MSQAVGQAELLQRLEQAYHQFQTLIGPLTPEQLQTPGVAGDWSVKDVIAHFIAHEQFALRELMHALRGSDGQTTEPDTATINERAVEQFQDHTVEAVLRAWDESFHQVVVAIQGLSTAEFDPAGPVAERLGGTIDGAFGNNTYEHYGEHTPAIMAWIQRMAIIDHG